MRSAIHLFSPWPCSPGVPQPGHRANTDGESGPAATQSNLGLRLHCRSVRDSRRCFKSARVYVCQARREPQTSLKLGVNLVRQSPKTWLPIS
jgi:hypothetical protein